VKLFSLKILQLNAHNVAYLLVFFMSLQNAYGYTPLMGACMTGQADIAKLLLEHKANVDYRDKLVISTLHT
jgi:ankyrin repeat protein